MPDDNLNRAIQFVQQGQDEQAQPILQALIQANPQDLTAWSWYVKSCRTPEKRLKALESCLRFNPNNAQIREAIQTMRGKMEAQPTPAFSLPVEQVTSPSSPDPYAYNADYTALATSESVNEIEAFNKPVRFLGLDESLGRPFIWYDVWWKALIRPNADTYTALVRDPLASPGRAYWWVCLAGIVTGLISLANPAVIQALDSLEKEQTGTNFIALALVVLVPVGAILSVLGLILGAAIYNLLAKPFGGSGNFSRTVYLMGAYSAPLSIVTGILSIIPLVSCLTIPLGFYSFWLNVTSVQVAQRLNGGRATIVVLIPALSVFMILCIVLAVTGQAFLDILKTLP